MAGLHQCYKQDMWIPPTNVSETTSLHNRASIFRDRDDAGRQLASLLPDYRDSDALVLAVPAGGVPVAVALAEELHLPLNVLVVSKITLPWSTEAGYGAVAADGTCQINDKVVEQARLDEATVNSGISKTKAKVAKRANTFFDITGHHDLTDRIIIIVDDGLASGFTLRVAIESAKNQKAKEIIVAVPTGYATSVIAVADQCDHFYCANVREGMRYAVADAYEKWSDVSEEEVITMLKRLGTLHQAP